MSTTTRRADRRTAVEMGQRLHAAKLAFCYSAVSDPSAHLTYKRAVRDALHALETYAVGRRKASIDYALKQMVRSVAKRNPTFDKKKVA